MHIKINSQLIFMVKMSRILSNKTIVQDMNLYLVMERIRIYLGTKRI